MPAASQISFRGEEKARREGPEVARLPHAGQPRGGTRLGSSVSGKGESESKQHNGDSGVGGTSRVATRWPQGQVAP